MAKIKLPSVAWNEGSLLRRTLLHVFAFVIGSAGFVALSSVLLLWIAKSVLPSRHATASDSDSDKGAEVAAAAAKPKSGPTKSQRAKTPEPTADAAAASDAR